MVWDRAVRTSRAGIAVVTMFIAASGCVRREGRNSDCIWPAESPPHAPTARHLSADAEFAEDLAIRYADVHHGLRTPHYVSRRDYAASRDRCMAELFERIAKQHGVTREQVAASLGRNRDRVDLAENLPFILLCCFGAVWAGQRIWSRYPPSDHGWFVGAAMALIVSLLFAVGCVAAGETWAWTVETWRVGNGHMSYRGDRLWWVQHRVEGFADAALAFLLSAAAGAWRVRQPRADTASATTRDGTN